MPVEAQPMTWPISAEYLRGPNNPWMRLSPALKHDRVPFNHHDDRQLALAHDTYDLTVTCTAAKRRNVGLLPRLHLRPTPCFTSERTKDGHLRILFEYRSRAPFQSPVNPSRAAVVQSLD
jgi:hypothetical protein